jgi:hypothetical protein
LIQKNILHPDDQDIEQAVKEGQITFKPTNEGLLPLRHTDLQRLGFDYQKSPFKIMKLVCSSICDEESRSVEECSSLALLSSGLQMLSPLQLDSGCEHYYSSSPSSTLSPSTVEQISSRDTILNKIRFFEQGIASAQRSKSSSKSPPHKDPNQVNRNQDIVSLFGIH